MRFALPFVILMMTAAGCTALAPPEPRCDLDADLCDAAWELAQPHLRPDDGEIQDVHIGPAGGAAECFPVACPELIGTTVYYRSGVEHSVILQVTGDLRVIDSERVDRGAPVPDGGGQELPPQGQE